MRNIDRLPLTCAPIGDWTWNPGMCPDQESIWQPFDLWQCPTNRATLVREGRVYLVLLEIAKLSSKVTAPFCIPTSKNESFYCCMSLSTFNVISVSGFGHLNRGAVASLCCFDLQFSNDMILNIFYAYLSSVYLLWWGVCSGLLPIFNIGLKRTEF